VLKDRFRLPGLENETDRHGGDTRFAPDTFGKRHLEAGRAEHARSGRRAGDPTRGAIDDRAP
jgi:hypothetical protein